MKILIGYDGSACSEAALDDLETAGLPEEAEAVVMSVSEVWLSPPPENENLTVYAMDLQTHPRSFKAYATNAKTAGEAETFAKHAQSRLQKMFPAWRVTAEANYGSPTWEIITKANEIKADLIVVGSHGRSAVGRFFLGSISNKVLSEAHCSVRIARGRVEVDPSPPQRVIIGYDGSLGASAAVEAVVARNWRDESDFKIVVATDSLVPTSIGRFVQPVTGWVEDKMKIESEWLEKLAQPALQTLKDAHLKATLQIVAGNPKQVLVEEALRWHADSIFVGANRYGSRREKFLLGSVSAAVAARAHCSVEAVRS